MSRFPRLIAVAVLGLVVAACAEPGTSPASGDGDPVLVFAAASLKGAMDEAASAYAAGGGGPVRVSYAASSTLARQIEHGAPADVFLSADEDWMDWLQERGLVDPGTRRDLLGNTLVLVAPAAGDTSPLDLAAGPGPLLARVGEGPFAIAMADAVPAGKYAREALSALGAWDRLRARAAEGDSVRAALMLVARGEAPLGVVYATDALAEPRVRVVARVPVALHAPITYPVARVAAGGHAGAAGFITWLGSPGAGAIFKRHGFSLR